MNYKCPDCGGTMKHKMRFSKDKRRKKPKVIYDLVCSSCGYVKPKLGG